MDLCRLCLARDVELLKVTSNDDLHSKIKECVSIEMLDDDELPTTACTSCVKKVDDWKDFKLMCLSSTETLKQEKFKRLEEDDDDENKTEIEELNNLEIEDDARLSYFRQCKKEDPYSSDDSSSDFDFSCSNDDDLDNDDKISLINNTYECSICQKEFDNCFDYLDHQIEHDGEPVFKCSKCTEVFSRRKDLVAHDMNHKITCPKCGKIILKSSLKLHLVKHSDRHVCPHCSSHFNSRVTMNQHIITIHTDIKDHVCETCGKRFSSMTAMKVHLKSHSEAREYKCKLCSYAGKTASAIYVHMSTHAKDVCVCEVCSKIFKSNRNLYDHLRRVHSVEKKHECNQCNKKFVDKYMLTVHMRTHTGVRPYKCDICDKAFIRSDGLKEHLATHSVRIKHECAKCGKQFTSKRGVTRHHCNSMA